jgi:RNA polymerase sigma factor (sigma-70 family)
MSAPTRGGLLAFLIRAAPPATDADAVLLDRFVRQREDVAFAALVRRHGPMVYGVCRRRLGEGPDAEDAFQATFLALARDAARITDPAALPGWLYRVAYLIALKAAERRIATHPLPHATLPARDLLPDAAAANRELQTVLDAELAALPDRLRTVAVLCLLEERTNAEAARLLGVPTGTVDSRLHAARKRLQARLLRRGAAAVTLTGLAERTAGAGFETLAARTVDLATTFAGGGPPACEAITSLLNGVPTMTTTTQKVLAAAVLSAALIGGTGFGVYYATAGSGPSPQSEAQPPEAKPPADPPKPERGTLITTAEMPAPGTTAATTAILSKPAGFEDPIVNITVGELLHMLSVEHGVTFRLDLGLLKQLGIQKPYEQQVSFPVVKGMTVQDILNDLIDQFGLNDDFTQRSYVFRARGSQVVLSKAFQVPTIPGSGGDVLMIPASDIAEMLTGPPVSISVTNRPLIEFIDLLREQTGANIVVDRRLGDKLNQPVTLTLNDSRLRTALKLAADMCLVGVAVVDNVFYVTDLLNARQLMQATMADLLGCQQQAKPQK